MSDIDYQAFYEFAQEKLATSPNMSIKDLSAEFAQQDITVTDTDKAIANMNQEQTDKYIAAQIQIECGMAVH